MWEGRISQMKMSLEVYKKKVENNLIKQVGEKEALRLMKEYEDDFPEFLQDNWSIAGSVTAIIQGY